MSRALRLGILAVALVIGAATAEAQRPQTVVLRGHALTLYAYGSQSGDPVIVSSGDGGWIHLGPHVAGILAAKGFYVLGFDVKAYLASFTSGSATLGVGDEPGDYRALADLASKATSKRPILIGVSEGAGLSVLAATDPRTKAAILGVIGLGLPNLNELGWRWRDSVIYLTHRVPKEPTFSAAEIVANLAPVPLAAIHSTSDEFVPLAEIQDIVGRASEPKRLWIVTASDHRFSGGLPEFEQRLFEAIAWVRQNSPR